MIDHPILFSTEMVQALLDGRKRQTRRLLNPQPSFYVGQIITPGDEQFFHPGEKDGWRPSKVWKLSEPTGTNGGCLTQHYKCRFGQPGDLLWVRESSAITYSTFKSKRTVFYKADNPEIPDRTTFKWKPSIHMVKAVARIWLQTTAPITIERAHDINDEDAKAEGLKCISKDGGKTWKWGIPDSDGYPGNDDYGWPWQEWETSPKKAFEKLWRKINGDDSWESNPYVWVIKFRILSLNGRPKNELLTEMAK
jgi:hypothetical protein